MALITVCGHVYAGMTGEIIDACRTALDRLVPSGSSLLSDGHRVWLSDWSAKYRYYPEAGSLSEITFSPILLSRLGEIPVEVRRELFFPRDRAITSRQMMARLQEAGIDPNANYVLRFAIEKLRDRDYSYEQLEQDILRARQQVDAGTLAQMAERLKDRVQYNEIAALLANRKTREYQIKVGPHSIQMPDGHVYPIHRRALNQELIVDVPADRVIGDSNSGHLKERNYNSKRIDGLFFPDGRFYTTDVDSWARARVFVNNNHNRVTIRPDADGRFYSRTHFDVMSQFSPRWFSLYWDQLSADQKADLRIHAELSPYTVMDDVYFKFSRRLPPFN